MSDDIARYSFLPWLRQGIANSITAADGDASVKARATIHVALNASATPPGGGAPATRTAAQDIALYGPGDVVGIDVNAIFRTDPHPWITNYESNYLAAVEFYDEDFPWRYTPAAPDAGGLHLRPWLTLVVLKETEFTDGQDLRGRPLPYIDISNPAAFPPASELWAWAHVHFNQDLAGSPGELVTLDLGAVLARAQATLGRNRDLAYSRIVCPRRLEDNTAYHAFVIPTFESGRLAGLGQDPAAAPHATFTAWDDYPGRAQPTANPVYHRWYFRTGERGDFEFLVRLLKPQPVDARIGSRPMDVQAPGSALPPVANPALGGVLRLGGALEVPDADLNAQEKQARDQFESWDQPYPDAFQKALAALINLPDEYAARSAQDANAASGLGPGVADDPDPLITAPLYGQWHALTRRLLTNRDGTPAPDSTNWIHRLNLDPRFRVPAALGAGVVEANVEEYMNDAWQQVGDVLAANQRVRQLHLAIGAAQWWFDRHLTPLVAVNAERAFVIAAPVARRIVAAGSTVAFAQTAALVRPALTSTAMRRVVRPGGRTLRSLPFTPAITPANLLARVNSGEVSAAPPLPPPPGLPTVDQVAGAAAPPGAPPWLLQLLVDYPWLPLALLVLAALLWLLLALVLPVGLAVLLGLLIGGATFYVYRLLQGWAFANGPAQALGEARQTPAAIAVMPGNASFVLSTPGSSLRPQPGGVDSPTAVRFKTALGDWYALKVAGQAGGQRPAPTTLELPALTGTMVAAIDPSLTIPARGLTTLNLPPWILGEIGPAFNEVMAYPKIDLPMYAPLKGLSVEYFLPNLNLIPDNSITLVETNQRFIEAYMAGLNHEFARKLLWRGYPTDQRGSYFRQFWDVGSHIDSEGLSTDALKEKLYDIPPLHTWAPASALGAHDHRATTQGSPQAVLVIRGELLKRYPTAVIFAQHARWGLTDGRIDPGLPRSLDELTSAEEALPPRTKIRGPLYEAKADPDIYFFGFDLTVDEAKGQSGQNPTDDAGWFFVIKQRPGEPRFGLEVDRNGPITIFDQVTWGDVVPAVAPGGLLPAGSLAPVALATPAATDPDRDQHDDDAQVNGAASTSARWAYLLFRAPVMVAVHADEMLA